jgi:rhodanese-related sulfurtransferase
MAGFVAENILEKRLNVIPWSKVADIKSDDILIDVRTALEFVEGNIPGSINIPVDELRSRLHEIDKQRNIYIYCQIGLRGYLAQRILLQNGFQQVLNISGGYKLWSACDLESNIKQSSLVL